MTYQNLLLDTTEGIGTVSFNRPAALNALNAETVQELHQALQEMEDNPDVKVVILTGTGDRAFIAGADISELRNMNYLEAVRFSKLGHAALDRIEGLKKVVIAAVNGFALGGGTEVALACDFIFASEKAKFGLPEVTLGIFPGWGGTQRLPRLIGKAKAKELLFTGAVIAAQEARELGIVNRVFRASSLMEETGKVAAQIAANGPVAIQLLKATVNRGSEVGLKTGCQLETATFGGLFTTSDQKEGMAAFVEKRKPRFKGE